MLLTAGLWLIMTHSHRVIWDRIAAMVGMAICAMLLVVAAAELVSNLNDS